MYKPVYTDVKEVYNGAKRAVLSPTKEKNESFDEKKKKKSAGWAEGE